jgi:hypothetical protein
VTRLVHVHNLPALDKPLEFIVQALVAEEAARGTDISCKLMETIELWARERNFSSV